MAPGRRGRYPRYDDYRRDVPAGGVNVNNDVVPLPQRILIYVIFFSIPGLLLFIVPTVKIGGGGGGGGGRLIPAGGGGAGASAGVLGGVVRGGASSFSTPRHMGGHQTIPARPRPRPTTYKNNAESELLLEDLTAGVGEIADDFMRSNEMQHLQQQKEQNPTVVRGNKMPSADKGGATDDGLGELADPDEDPTTPVTHMESSTRPDTTSGGHSSSSSSSTSNDKDDKESMKMAARGWGAELGINSSYARSEKLYKLVRPRVNLDMRLFMSLKGISKDCRYLAEGDGRVPNPNLANKQKP